MATIKFSKKAAKFMGAGRSWPKPGRDGAQDTHPGYGLWETTATSAIFGGITTENISNTNIVSVLNIYKGTVSSVSAFTDLASRENDLLVSFKYYHSTNSGQIVDLGYITATNSHRYVCGRHLNFTPAVRSGTATWFAAVNYCEISDEFQFRTPTIGFTTNTSSATWIMPLDDLNKNKLFDEPTFIKSLIYASSTGTSTTASIISSTITTSSVIIQFSTATTGTAVLAFTATFFGGGFDGQPVVSPSKGVIPADEFIYGSFTNVINSYQYSGAAKYAHYRRGAMIGTVGELYSTSDLQILTTNIVQGERYNCAGIFLNFPLIWTI